MTPKSRLAIAIACAAASAACASSYPPPNDEWAAAQADVGRAQSAGAPDVPDAKLHLQLAEEDLQRSRALIGNDNRRASTLTEVARAEALLALSLARQNQAEAQERLAQGELSKTSAH